MKAKKYFVENLLPPLLGLSMFILLWSVLAQNSPNLPNPLKTWHSAVSLFSDPFYIKGPNEHVGQSGREQNFGEHFPFGQIKHPRHIEIILRQLSYTHCGIDDHRPDT